MQHEVEFSITNQSFEPHFGLTNEVSDGGFERGYAAGYEKGNVDGLAARTYETWKITLADGSVIEKDAALL